jgi:WD40 repeat protein
VIRLQEVATGKELAQFTGHEGAIKAIAFAPGGKTLVTGSEDTTALVWDLAQIVKKRRPAP